MIWKPWAFLLVAVAGWMNRQQQEVIEYLNEENRILREKLGPKRILLSVAPFSYSTAATMTASIPTRDSAIFVNQPACVSCGTPSPLWSIVTVT